MSVRLSCPSCNANFTVGEIPPDRRATCPRCGDVFPVRGVEEEGSGLRGQGPGEREQATEVENPPPVSVPTPKPQGGSSGRRLAPLAVTVGLLALAVGLAVYFTRPRQPPPEPEPPKTARPPAQLEGLGYLPAECNVVFAVQPGPVIAFAERTGQDPRELLARAGVPAALLSVLDQAGLKLAQVNHVAGGLFVGGGLPGGLGEQPLAALALVLNQPLVNEGDFLERLNAKHAAGRESQYDVRLDNTPFSPVLTRAAPNVWVFTLSNGAAGKSHGPGGAQFRGSESDGVRGMVAAVPPDAAVWAVADDEQDWTQKPLVKLASGLPQLNKWVPAAEEARGGMAAVSLGEQPRLKLVARVSDPETAGRVRKYFQARAAERSSAAAGGEGTLATFEAPFDPATSWGMVQKFLEDAKK